MEILFFAGICLLMVATVYCAPRIVRKRISFTAFAALVVLYYGFLFVFTEGSVGYALLTAICLCSVGYALLLKKKKQHDPNLMTQENCRTSSDLQLFRLQGIRLSKLNCYKRWYRNLLFLNISAVIVFFIAKFCH